MNDEGKTTTDAARGTDLAQSDSQHLKIVIDRIEDDVATLVLYEDDRVQFNLPVEYLPKGVKGGDHFQVVFKKDSQSRAAEKQKAEQLLKELLGQSDEGEKK
ncbi:MAG: DUF3006 domain-containing protein [Acidobacteria bacterium]|nr:DUF3006 domain-containing protein [Acidobacteriota bacterium]